jgi:glutamate-1-semialdehyde 2,1-aminomutase
VVGGGMPLGAFGGRREIMEKIAPLGPVYQAGTLSGNPLSVAAGLVTLKKVAAPGFYETLTARTTTSLVEGLGRARRKQHGVKFSAQSVGGMFGVYFAATPPTVLCRSNGVGQGGFQPFFPCHARCGRLSGALGFRGRVCFGRAFSDADIAATVAAAEAIFARG